MLVKPLKNSIGEGVCMCAHVCKVLWADGGEGGTRQGRAPKVKIHFMHTWTDGRLPAEQLTNLIERMKASFSWLLHNNSRLNGEKRNTLELLSWQCAPETKWEPLSQRTLYQQGTEKVLRAPRTGRPMEFSVQSFDDSFLNFPKMKLFWFF